MKLHFMMANHEIVEFIAIMQRLIDKLIVFFLKRIYYTDAFSNKKN